MENNVKTNGETKDVDYKVLKSNIIKLLLIFIKLF